MDWSRSVEMRKAVQRRREAFKEAWPWVLGALVVLSSGWAADGIRDIFEALMGNEKLEALSVIIRVGYLLVFVCTVVGLALTGRSLFRPRTRSLSSKLPKKRKHLVLFLSDLDISKGSYVEGVPAWLTLIGSLDNDIKSMEELKEKKLFWKWEMPLRGIRHHLGKLQSITIVCSPESIKQVHWFCGILNLYAPLNGVKKWIYGVQDDRPSLAKCDEEDGLKKLEGWDFENFDDLSRALHLRMRMFLSEGVSEKDIMIDFTGGLKVTSAVAVAVTFNCKVEAQYVRTTKPCNVISYDVVFGTQEAGGLGL